MKKFALPLLMAALALPTFAHAAALTAEQKAEVEAIVKEYILKSGGDIIQSVNDFQVKQEEESVQKAEVQAKDLIAQLKSDKNVASVGNPDGDIIVVEFFDYHCGYCKKALPEVLTLLEEDKNVRVVLYDMPILGPDSYTASKWALASKKQNKYFEFHKAAMNHKGAFEVADLKKISQEAGINVDQIVKDVEDPKIEEELRSHLEKAKDLGIQGTPAFLINEKVFRGYIPQDVIKSTIAELRAAKKAE